MKDTQLRGIILGRYYDRRREGWFLPKPEELGVEVTSQDILAVCDQLGEHNLLEWKVRKDHGVIHAGMGKITAFGIDVVEGEAVADIKVEFVQNKTINISGSNNVVVGDNNSQSISNHVSGLLSIIDSANATSDQKDEAKGALRKFLEHPLVAAVAGGAIGLLG